MRFALKSSFFRLFRTRLFIWVIVFSLLTGIGVFNSVCGNEVMMYTLPSLGRPRFFDNDFLILCLKDLIYVFPFGAAVFCMMFTGSDISFRAVNNKIATGTPRVMIFFADAAVAALTALFSVIVSAAALFLLVKFVPVKESVEINSKVILTVLFVAVIVIAFVLFFTMLQVFFSNKLFGVIISMFLIPALMSYPGQINYILDQPYRYSYKDETSGETVWELNPEYVGGVERNALTFSLELNPYYGVLMREPGNAKCAAAAGAVIVLSAAAGALAISRKEFT